jgi:hypothetical protein
MKHLTQVHPLIRIPIVCAIACMLVVSLAACPLSSGGGSSGENQNSPPPPPQEDTTPSTIVVTDYQYTAKDPNGHRTVRVFYDVTHINSADKARLGGLSVQCWLNSDSSNKDRSYNPDLSSPQDNTMEKAGPGQTLIIINDNAQAGTYYASCRLRAGFSTDIVSDTLKDKPISVSCLNPQGGGPQVVLATEDCTPTPTETPAPTPVTFSNIKLYVNGQYYTEDQTRVNPLMIKVGTPISLRATWDGGALDGTGWWVVILEQGKGYLTKCDTGSTCETTDVFTSPIPGRVYDAELHEPSGYWVHSNIVFVDWVS